MSPKCCLKINYPSLSFFTIECYSRTTYIKFKFVNYRTSKFSGLRNFVTGGTCKFKDFKLLVAVTALLKFSSLSLATLYTRRYVMLDRCNFRLEQVTG